MSEVFIWVATARNGSFKDFSARTESDAYQQACSWALDKGGLNSFSRR